MSMQTGVRGGVSLPPALCIHTLPPRSASQRRGSEGDVQPFKAGAGGLEGGEQASCLPQCPAGAAQGGVLCSAEERGLPSSRPCAARLDTALRSPGTGMRNRALRAVEDELAPPKKAQEGIAEGSPTGSLLLCFLKACHHVSAGLCF